MEDKSDEQESSASTTDAISDDDATVEDATVDDEDTVDDDATVDDGAVRTETPATTTDPQTDEDPVVTVPELTHRSEYKPNLVVSAATTDSPSDNADGATPDAFVLPAANVDAAQEPSTTVSVTSARSRVTASASGATVLATTDKALLPAAQAAPAPAGPLDVVTRFVSEMLAWVGLGSSMGTAPATPAAQPSVWGLLAWARREIQRTFFNQTPTMTYNPADTSQTVDDRVVTALIGDVGAVDADGDRMKVTLVEGPQKGTVVVNPDGTFTYTPGRELAAAGGTDVFVVKAADIGFHLHGPLGVFRTDFGRSVTNTVEVVVDPHCPGSCTVNPVTVIGTINVGEAPDGVAFSPDGSRAYVANALSNTVSVINVASGTVVATIPVGEHPRGVAVNPVQPRAYVTNLLDDSVSVINTTNNTVIATVNVGSGAERVAVSGGGTRAYVITIGGDGLTVINTATNTVSSTVELNGAAYGVAVHPNGGRIFVATQIDWLEVVDSVTFDVTHIDTDKGWMHGIDTSPLGTRVYIANSDEGTVSVRSTNNNAVLATINVGEDPRGLAVSPDGTRAYVVNKADNTLSVIKTATNSVIATVPVGSSPNEVAISPDGTRAYVTNSFNDNVSVLTLV